jgi:hypothetical protein
VGTPRACHFNNQANTEMDARLVALKGAAARDFYGMSFEGMGQSIQTVEASIHSSTPLAHRLDELPAGYSLTVCSPA